MPFKNKEQRNAYAREWYARPGNSKKHYAMVRARKNELARDQAVLISAFKKDGCAFCPEKHPCCLAAHHKDPKQKDFEVASAKSLSMSLKRLAAELAKCVCVCSNCHRKIHSGVLSSP